MKMKSNYYIYEKLVERMRTDIEDGYEANKHFYDYFYSEIKS